MRGRDLRFLKRPALWVAAAAAVGAWCALGLIGTSTGSTEAVPGDAAAGRPPVVMIVFDAFPTVSLLNAHSRIDGARYPTFARLAADSTWFPYATTSVDETGHAFREIFTSRTSWRFAKPTYAKHPNNLFPLLGRRYHVEASEEGTSFCPKRLCPDVIQQSRDSILRELEAGRPERFLAWLERFSPSRRPTFYFKHVLLPHTPWVYLPSGHTYYDGPSEHGLSRDDPWLVQQRYQRHLLQVEFTDRLLGLALEQLRATGLYERSLIVVTADHGESFGRPGNGREVDRRTVGDIALKPLFVKLPFQHAGRIDRRHVRNLDILPTIARVARLRPGWRVEGRSVFGRAARRIPRSTRDGQAQRRALPAEPEIAAPPPRGFAAAEAEAVRQFPRSVRDRTAPGNAWHPCRALAGVAGRRRPRGGRLRRLVPRRPARLAVTAGEGDRPTGRSRQRCPARPRGRGQRDDRGDRARDRPGSKLQRLSP